MIMDYKQRAEVKLASIKGVIRQQKEENDNLRANIDNLNQRLNDGIRNLTALIGAQQVLQEVLEEEKPKEKPTKEK